MTSQQTKRKQDENDAIVVSAAEGLRIQDLLVPAWASRKKIFLLALAVSIVVLGVNFLLPMYYKSSAVLLPETEQGKLGVMGQVAGIASLAGIDVAGGDISRLYPVIATSEAVLRRVIERPYVTERHSTPVNLVEYLDPEQGTKEKDFEETLKSVQGLMETQYDSKTQVVTITLQMREPQLAADVLNALVEELDRFIREERTTGASEQARWIGARLLEVEAELRAAEDSLKEFRERNRRVIDSPELLLRQARFERDVTLKSTIFVELKKQYELAKIEEIKNISVVNVLDHARPAVKKERPKRATNTVIAFLATLIASALYVGLAPHYSGHVRRFLARLREAATLQKQGGTE